jgi:hypothetical protein
MKIFIVEIKSSHHSVVELIKYANPIINDVQLFTVSNFVSDIENKLDDLRSYVSINVKRKNQSYFSFIKNINNLSKNNVDFLIINTLTRWEFMFLKPKCFTIAYLYSLNFWSYDLASNKMLFWPNMNNLYLNILSFFPIRWHVNPIFGKYIRKKIMEKVDAVFVEYPLFIDYIKNAKNYNKPTYFLPNKYYYEKSSDNKNKKIIFVIPGMISEKRRDYETILIAFEKIPKILLKGLKLILLGRPIENYGLNIINRAKKLSQIGLETIWYDEYIPNSIFNDSLVEADILLAPINFNYSSGVIKEKYTYTKGTGTFADMLSFSIPTIVPNYYNIAEEFKDCFITYKSADDLRNLIITFKTDQKKLKDIKNKTKEVIQRYNLKYFQNEFSSILLKHSDNKID